MLGGCGTVSAAIGVAVNESTLEKTPQLIPPMCCICFRMNVYKTKVGLKIDHQTFPFGMVCSQSQIVLNLPAGYTNTLLGMYICL